MTYQVLLCKAGLFVCLAVVFGLPAEIIKAAGQSKVNKPKDAQAGAEQVAPKKNAIPFKCPDPLAAEACKSFEELYKAGDEGVHSLFSMRSTTYVCFRPSTDEFFIVELTNASFRPQHLDRQTGQLVPDDDATAPGRGFIAAFAHGIQDVSILPIISFAGEWMTPMIPTFTAKRINHEEIPNPDRYGVAADPQQFNADWRYKNRFDKEIDYHLVIQRSTGRFSESFTEESSKIPFLETNGHCSQPPLMQLQRRRSP